MTAIMFLLFVVQLYSQKSKLQSSESHVLVNVYVKDLDNTPRPNERIIIIAQATKGKYQRISNEKGEFSLLLPKGDKYKIMYEDLGSEVDYSFLSIPSDSGLFTFEVNVRFENNIVQPLENVTFENGKADLTIESYPELNRLVDLMKRKPTMVIEIAGHTDNLGSSEDNMSLSQSRADSVRAYLTKCGITATRVYAKGYGDTEPIEENTSDEGRRQNRRAEVRILKE